MMKVLLFVSAHSVALGLYFKNIFERDYIKVCVTLYIEIVQTDEDLGHSEVYAMSLGMAGRI